MVIIYCAKCGNELQNDERPCPSCGSTVRNAKHTAFDKVKVNIELAKWGVQNYAPSAFYKNLDKIKEYEDLAKCAVKNNASNAFYSN